MPFRSETAESQLVGIGVDLTEVCNRHCPTCFAASTPRQMSRDMFRRIVDEGARTGFGEFYILGGEPTLYPEIIDLLGYAHSKFGLVILVTNMDRLANIDFCRDVESTGVVIAGQRHSVSISPEVRLMERLLAGGDHLGSSTRAWANVAKIFPANRVCVQCCITRPVVDSGSIYEVFRFCRRHGYEPVMEFTKEGGRFKRGGELDVSPAEMMGVLSEFQRIDREEFGLPGAELLGPQAYGKTCHMQENSIHFRVDGEAITCVGHPAMGYGNIMASALDEILAHPLRHHFANPADWIYGYCREECPHFASCAGGCRGSSFDISGCYRASFYYCPHIPRDRLTLKDMIPPSCDSCPLNGHPSCRPRR